jgi:endoglucanase
MPRAWSAVSLPLWTLAALLGASACAKGTGDPYADARQPENGDDPAPDDEAPESPSEVELDVDDNGAHAEDEVGFVGSWEGSTGPESELELAFEDGDVCFRGQTAQVLDGDFRTHWGAQARFDLCNQAGDPMAASQCLAGTAASDFVGVRFALEGSAVPWLVVLQFNETGRETPASVWLQTAGETTAFFSRATNPFDSSAPAVNPRNLESITVRAAGLTEGVQAFDFCVRDLRALFGPEWEDALVPDWIDEPGPGRQVAYVGANLVGAEFGEDNLPGVYGTDYIYPSSEDVTAYAGRGMNVFRVPFRWERLQQELYADLDATELDYLKSVVTAAREHDARVILDPHNFARYEDDTSDDAELLVGVDIEADALADLWAKLAREFKNDDRVFFGLMNEPHTMETETWLEAANLAIAAIREQGAQNLVLVPGNQWTGAHAWFEDYYGTPNADAMRGFVDPEDNFAFELHQYFDSNSSGTSNTCVSESIGVERVERVTGWLRDEGFLGFLGEFGGSDDPVCLGAMDQLLSHLGENSDVWLGWTVWASTEWNIQHNIRPVNGQDPLQMRVLMRHLQSE